MKTLEELLRTKVTSKFVSEGKRIEITPIFRVAVQGEADNAVHIIIHPQDYDGDTLDFLVTGNVLTPIGL